MNLQVCVPYEKCPFNCPMCIASNRKIYENLYDKCEELYFNRLKKQIENNYDFYVITGQTEPTLNRKWLENTLKVLKGQKVELQTKNYNLHNYNLEGLSTLCYSITSVKDYIKAYSFRKIVGSNRLVILLTKDFDFLNIENFETFGFNQITFKVLQKTNDKKVNTWIEKNEMKDFTKIYEIVNFYNGRNVSVRIDTNCQDSHGRYRIFREDGQLYYNWEIETPL